MPLTVSMCSPNCVPSCIYCVSAQVAEFHWQDPMEENKRKALCLNVNVHVFVCLYGTRSCSDVLQAFFFPPGLCQRRKRERKKLKFLHTYVVNVLLEKS